MKIDVSMRYSDVDREELPHSVVIVIDVLRCTSVMINAIANGCERIIPVLEPEYAIELADRLGRPNCVLGGERGCNKLPGFDVGNSPLEYTPEIVQGKTVVITTSNGTNAIKACSSSKLLLIGALLNSRAVAEAAFNTATDIMLVCSGTAGKVSADDLIAAGGIITELLELADEYELSDSALVCKALFDSWSYSSFNLTSTAHCVRLIRLGYGSDVEFCMRSGEFDVVPYFDGDCIKRYKPKNV